MRLDHTWTKIKEANGTIEECSECGKTSIHIYGNWQYVKIGTNNNKKCSHYDSIKHTFDMHKFYESWVFNKYKSVQIVNYMVEIYECELCLLIGYGYLGEVKVIDNDQLVTSCDARMIQNILL